MEFRVNPEFGSKEAAQAEVEKYAHALGQMPAVLMPGIKHVDINAGEEVWGGNSDIGSIHIHTVWSSANIIEEAFVHEATHVTLDPAHGDSPGWRAAQAADGVFISEYARDHPDREDLAEELPGIPRREVSTREADRRRTNGDSEDNTKSPNLL